MADKARASLPDQDYLKVIDIIHRLYRCESRENLYKVLKEQIFPLLKSHQFSASWTDVDLKAKTQGQGKPFCQIGFTDKDLEIAGELFPYHKELLQKFTTSMRPVLTYGLDLTEESLQLVFDEFFKDHPHYNREDYPALNSIKDGITMVDPPDFSIGIGFSRKLDSSSEPYTYKEVRIAEFLQPSLIRALKFIAVNEELKTYRSLVENLANVPAPIALVHPQGLIAFGNEAFQKITGRKKGGFLPDALTALLKQKEEALSAPEELDSAIDSITFFKFPGGKVRCSWTRLHQPGISEDGCWLLKMKPAEDPYSKTLLALTQAELTPREIEVTVRVCDGIDDAEIAQRLFISSQTVKNHLKSIYKKLDVHSRTQLIASLNPSK
jgi:DNA-binding CsgD family transcriptional regulator